MSEGEGEQDKPELEEGKERENEDNFQYSRLQEMEEMTQASFVTTDEGTSVSLDQPSSHSAVATFTLSDHSVQRAEDLSS